MIPKIIGEEEILGINNGDLDKAIERVDRSKMYKDLSTIIICPTRGMFPTRVVQSWMKLMRPMNQRVAGPIFAESMKVDVAYNSLIKYILGNKHLSTYKYILTIEEDNLPPPDGLIKLYESMDEYDVVAGLYWGKGENGFPMMFGDPEGGDPLDSKPVLPIKDSVQRVNALGMGFNLFKLDMFRQIPEPWFKTVEEYDPLVTGEGNGMSMTQDFYFYRLAHQHGYKFACDTRILVSHYESKTDTLW
jgi:hypothetical protein